VVLEEEIEVDSEETVEAGSAAVEVVSAVIEEEVDFVEDVEEIAVAADSEEDVVVSAEIEEAAEEALGVVEVALVMQRPNHHKTRRLSLTKCIFLKEHEALGERKPIRT